MIDVSGPPTPTRPWYRRLPWWGWAASAVVVALVVAAAVVAGHRSPDAPAGPVTGPIGALPGWLDPALPAGSARVAARLPGGRDRQPVTTDHLHALEVQAYHGLLVEWVLPAGADDAEVQVVNARTGAAYWTYREPGKDVDTAQVDASTGRLYVLWVGSDRLTLAEVDLRTGRLGWRTGLGPLRGLGVGTTAGVDQVMPGSDRVVVRGTNGFAVVSAASGRLQRTVRLPTSCRADGQDESTDRLGAPVLVGDVLVLQMSCGAPVGDEYRGHLSVAGWRVTSGAPTFSGRLDHLVDLSGRTHPDALTADLVPLDAHTVLVGVGGAGHAVLLDTGTGRSARTVPFPDVQAAAGGTGIGECDPYPAEGVSGFRALCGYSLADGSARWRLPLPGGLVFDELFEGLVVTGGRVYLLAAPPYQGPYGGWFPQHLITVDAAGGTLLGQTTIAAPDAPHHGLGFDAWLETVADGRGLAVTYRTGLDGSILTSRST